MAINKKMQVFGLLSPKYFKPVFNKIYLSLYAKFFPYNATKLRKLNKSYCQSFYKFFESSGNYNYFTNEGVEPLKDVVFVFWNGGVEKMPKIARLCYERLISITRFKVILLDNENYKNYSTIDQRIINMYEKGDIPIQLFADILRVNLLAIHDCIWMDSTLFLRHDFPEDILSSNFTSPYRGENKFLFEDIPNFYQYPDLSLSQNYFLAGKNKKIFIAWYNLLLSYLFNETKFLKVARPYYLSYFTVEYLNDNNSEFYKYLQERTLSNRNVEKVEGLKDEIYDENKFAYIFDKDTYIYKLSYKMKFNFKKNDNLTVFGKFAELYNIKESDID